MGKGPGGKHDNMRTYTPEEAQRVHELVKELHPQWTLIAKKVSEEFGAERSAASVRNYFKRFQDSADKRDKGIAKNRCQLCNQIKRGHICTPMTTTPGRRPGVSGDDHIIINVSRPTTMDVDVVPLAKPLAPDNGFMSIEKSMFDDIIFNQPQLDEPSPQPAPATSGSIFVAPPHTLSSCTPTVITVAPAPAVPAPPPVITFDEAPEKLPHPGLASASSLLALSTSPMPRFNALPSLPSPEDAAIPA